MSKKKFNPRQQKSKAPDSTIITLVVLGLVVAGLIILQLNPDMNVLNQ